MKFLKWDFDAGIVEEFERVGECNGCGQCCTGTIKYASSTEDDGIVWEGIWYEPSHGDKRTFTKITSIDIDPLKRCPLLTETNQCGVTNEKAVDRPVCYYWPFSEECVTPFDKCSYTFEKIGEWKIEDLT